MRNVISKLSAWVHQHLFSCVLNMDSSETEYARSRDRCAYARENGYVSHCKKGMWLSWLAEGSGGLICHHWWGDTGCGGQSLSDLEASVCSNSDGQNEMGARQSTLTSPSTPRPPAQPWPWAQQNCKVGPGTPHPSNSPVNPPSRPLHPGAAVSHQAPLHPPLSTNHHPDHPQPQPSVPFSSNRAVWPSSPAFNLPSRSGAEANKAPR